jgi:hypothetical protein
MQTMYIYIDMIYNLSIDLQRTCRLQKKTMIYYIYVYVYIFVMPHIYIGIDTVSYTCSQKL